MKTVRHGRNARDPLLHVETDGCIVNIHVGLTDVYGRRVTRVDVMPDGSNRGGDGEGRIWYADGPRIIRTHEVEDPPKRISDDMSPEEIEAALRTLAELYDNSDDTGEYLSGYQQKLAERVLHRATAIAAPSE